MLDTVDRSTARTAGEGLAAGNVIDGRTIPARSGATIDVSCPSDGVVFATIARSDAADVDAAVASARAAFETGPWARMSALERGRLLFALMDRIEQNAAELAALESRDTGKPVRQG